MAHIATYFILTSQPMKIKSHSIAIQITKALLFKLVVLISLCLFISTNSFATALQTPLKKHQTKDPDKKIKLSIPIDEYNRSTPKSTVEGFLKYASKGEFEKAANYLDFRYLPRNIRKVPKAELARKLKIIIDRALSVDPDTISDHPKGNLQDGLPPNKEIIGRIVTPKGGVDIILQRVPRKDGIKIWKFSHKTVSQIPLLYKYFGYKPLEQKISKLFPDIHILGWQLWQWCAYLILITISFLITWISTWILAFFIRWQYKKAKLSIKIGKFVTGPIRILIWLFSCRLIAEFLKPSAEIKELLHAGTLFLLGVCWASIRAIDILFELWSLRLQKNGKTSTTVLLKPLRTILRISIVTICALVWLDNLGFKVSALLAGLGVGGLAVALAAQGVLKNLLGTIMILADRPYSVGERIVVNGYDGEVEEIGLRSTSIRLLNGHQAIIPNDKIERTAVENIGRRPFIRRKQELTLALDTPPEKVKKALEILYEILKNHEGMKEEYPPQIYFNKFNKDGLNIVFYFWYHPPEYWQYLSFCQKVNLEILQRFKQEGIKLVPPTRFSLISGDEDATAITIKTLEQA